MRRVKLTGIDGMTSTEIVAAIKRKVSARHSQTKGAHAEEAIRRALIAAGYQMVERIATPCKIARGRLVYSQRVSGDFRAILPLRVRLGSAIDAVRNIGLSVLVECKARDASLAWGAFEAHQTEALDRHVELGGDSVVGWYRSGMAILMDWSALRTDGFGPRKSVVWDENRCAYMVR